jgi:hypothetical protein
MVVDTYGQDLYFTSKKKKIIRKKSVKVGCQRTLFFTNNGIAQN